MRPRDLCPFCRSIVMYSERSSQPFCPYCGHRFILSEGDGFDDSAEVDFEEDDFEYTGFGYGLYKTTLREDYSSSNYPNSTVNYADDNVCDYHNPQNNEDNLDIEDVCLQKNDVHEEIECKRQEKEIELKKFESEKEDVESFLNEVEEKLRNYEFGDSDGQTENDNVVAVDADINKTENSKNDTIPKPMDKGAEAQGPSVFVYFLFIFIAIVFVSAFMSFMLDNSSSKKNKSNTSTSIEYGPSYSYSIEQIETLLAMHYDNYYGHDISNVEISEGKTKLYSVFYLLIPSYLKELSIANDGPPGEYYKKLSKLESELEEFIITHKAPPDSDPYAICIISSEPVDRNYQYEYFVSPDFKYSSLK